MAWAQVGRDFSQPGVSSSRAPRVGSQHVRPRTGRASSAGWPLGSPAGRSTASGACRTMARNGRSSSPWLCRYGLALASHDRLQGHHAATWWRAMENGGGPCRACSYLSWFLLLCRVWFCLTGFNCLHFGCFVPKPPGSPVIPLPDGVFP